MLIEIHMIQNHSPANLNRDDLGAPKTCYFGGVLRSRISSQCLKRSIRMSPQFSNLSPWPRGVRTRQLARLIAKEVGDGPGAMAASTRAEEILRLCGFGTKDQASSDADDETVLEGGPSKALVFTTLEAIQELAMLLKESKGKEDGELAQSFARIIAQGTAAPDMALFGRMLEPGKPAGEAKKEVWKQVEKVWRENSRWKRVEAAAQVAHAISTHEARPEVDYYVAKDDVPGEDSGAGYVDEAMFSSACFYKYFSINWDALIENLQGTDESEQIARDTVCAFLRAAALVAPSGKQNSFAAHNPPEGILVEMRETPISYSNAFAMPVTSGRRDLIGQSIAQMAQYVRDLDTGFGAPWSRLWFSPNDRHPLTAHESEKEHSVIDPSRGREKSLRSLEELVAEVAGLTKTFPVIHRKSAA